MFLSETSAALDQSDGVRALAAIGASYVSL